jgi:hypothetical protein
MVQPRFVAFSYVPAGSRAPAIVPCVASRTLTPRPDDIAMLASVVPAGSVMRPSSRSWSSPGGGVTFVSTSFGAARSEGTHAASSTTANSLNDVTWIVYVFALVLQHGTVPQRLDPHGGVIATPVLEDAQEDLQDRGTVDGAGGRVGIGPRESQRDGGVERHVLRVSFAAR